MLHPRVRWFLDFLEEHRIPPTHTLGVAQARAFAREHRSFSQPEPEAVAEVRELEASGPGGPVALRAYRPIGARADVLLPALLFFHGGGWVIGDLDTHDPLCRELANRAGCAVVAVNYSLGPERRFPAAVDDAVAAARWVHEHAGELRIDGSRLAVGGDSAGGTLAAVVSIAARESRDLPIAFQLLIYPATDLRRDMPSHAENGAGYWLTRETIDYFVGHYVADRAQYDDWRASPLRATDLSNLPPALIVTAGFDPLRDEGAAYAQRLSAAGNRAALVCFPRQIHGFILMSKIVDEAQTAIGICAAELGRALQSNRIDRHG